jgi:hypothetical protein
MLRNLIASALLSAAFLSLPLCAQFDNLVTTDDGSLLLFQSQWRLAGSGDGNLSKIYRWDSHGFTTVFSPVNPGLISPPFATSPVIAGDGTISGYLKYPGCSGSACSNTSYVPVLSGAALPSSVAPAVSLQISRNGRYLADGNTVLDRNTGTLQVVTAAGSGGPPPAARRWPVRDRQQRRPVISRAAPGLHRLDSRPGAFRPAGDDDRELFGGLHGRGQRRGESGSL